MVDPPAAEEEGAKLELSPEALEARERTLAAARRMQEAAQETKKKDEEDDAAEAEAKAQQEREAAGM